MKSTNLREKDKILLKLVVENYLAVGRPVSSGRITQSKRLPDSPATIRNIMAKLEDQGFLSQPHTSAGRIPTDKGLRFYVNSLLAESLFDFEQVHFDAKEFTAKGDLNSLLVQVSKVLANQSDNLGFVLSPRISRIHFNHLRFIKLPENKVMVLLITSSNLVLNEIVSTESYFTQVELERASQYINQNFRGRSLVFIRDFLLRELPQYRLKYEDMIGKLVSLLKAYILQEERGERIILDGASKLLGKADLFNAEKLKFLFRNFEEKAKLARLLSDFISLDRVKVLIGTESNDPDISDCSLILSHYGYDNQILGSLGIIGPKRIPYERIIPLVDCVAKKLSRTICEDH